MDEREQQRKVRHRLAVLRKAEEMSGNASATCRYYGISRQLFYKWQRRRAPLSRRRFLEPDTLDNSTRLHSGRGVHGVSISLRLRAA